MFDIGFWELVVVAVVALIVVGPDRLPGLVRTVGYWVGRTRSFVSAVQHEVKREMHNADVLRREAEEKAGLTDLTDLMETLDPERAPKSAEVAVEQLKPRATTDKPHGPT